MWRGRRGVGGAVEVRMLVGRGRGRGRGIWWRLRGGFWVVVRWVREGGLCWWVWILPEWVVSWRSFFVWLVFLTMLDFAVDSMIFCGIFNGDVWRKEILGF